MPTTRKRVAEAGVKNTTTRRKADTEADKRSPDTLEAEMRHQDAERQREYDERHNPARRPLNIHREIISGPRPGPHFGETFPVDQRSYMFRSAVAAQSGPGRVELRGAGREDIDWETQSYLIDGSNNRTVKAGFEGANEWRGLRFLRWVIFPLGRKPITVACEVEFLYDTDTFDTKHKPRYNPDIRAFELVVG